MHYEKQQKYPVENEAASIYISRQACMASPDNGIVRYAATLPGKRQEPSRLAALSVDYDFTNERNISKTGFPCCSSRIFLDYACYSRKQKISSFLLPAAHAARPRQKRGRTYQCERENEDIFRSR
ncbi:MAG: hypothetical protein HQK81_08500 [Desulfovibrionaceae bacterium]|nr:hypothetical protein [Desulfovibrionaceae bacterium]MBF0514090.1 hypothetical protein [Desulfovibrionaceae bacterium]